MVTGTFATLKRGTLIKNICLTGKEDEIECLRCATRKK